MSTTTIRLPEELKKRLKQVAERAGTTAHNFILEAIAEKTEQASRRLDFEEAANSRHARIKATGETIVWSEMRRYLEGRAEGKKLRKPAPRKLAP
jgi:predicted DNA-binding protein